MKYKKPIVKTIIISGIFFAILNRVAIIKLIGSVIESASEMIFVVKKQMGGMLFGVIMVCLCSIVGITVSILAAKLIDSREKGNGIKKRLAEKHPNINTLIGLFLVFIIASVLWGIVYYLLACLRIMIMKFIDWSTSAASKMDVVVIVALITGTVSIVSVIISSVIAKLIDYKKNRKEYLSQKREEPYGEFVEMVYKIQQNGKNNNSYTEKMMMDDLSKFSRQITLWGSTNVVKKWIKFREQGANPEAKIDNLFVLEDIMNEMRKDLGLRKVKKGNLLAFFVNDIKEVMRTKK